MPKTVGLSSNDSYNNQLQSYLRENRSVNNLNMTHTSMGKPLGSYYIKPSEYSNFMDMYYDTVFNNKNKTSLVETLKDTSGEHLEFQPLKIDLDFRYYSDKIERIYNLKEIADVCMKYMQIIDEYLEDLDEEERLF